MELNKEHISRANENSHFNRGDNTNKRYQSYLAEVDGWEIPEAKKEEIRSRVYKYFSRRIYLDAQYVPVTIAGPANYNSRRLDKSEQILRGACEFDEWFSRMREQARSVPRDVAYVGNLEWSIELSHTGQTCYSSVADKWRKLFRVNRAAFVALYDRLNQIKPFRKSSVAWKLYQQREDAPARGPRELFKDENLTVTASDGRVYLQFRMRPKPQLIFALKKRGYWWNSHVQAWSTYENRADKEWLEQITAEYKQYL